MSERVRAARPWVVKQPAPGRRREGQETIMITFPNESAKYRTAREKLLKKEIELRRAMEAVAEARRTLPPGGLVPEHYVFDALDAEGRPAKVKLTDLFAP